VKFGAGRANRRFQFQKGSQPFIRLHNETLSVVAMCVSNEDCSPGRIDRCNTAPTPTGFAEVVRDDFPVLHRSVFAVTAIFARIARITSRARAVSMNLRRVLGCIGRRCLRHASEGAREYDSSEDCNFFHVLGIMRLALSG
jgi:hypothetical protein